MQVELLFKEMIDKINNYKPSNNNTILTTEKWDNRKGTLHFPNHLECIVKYKRVEVATTAELYIYTDASHKSFNKIEILELNSVPERKKGGSAVFDEIKKLCVYLKIPKIVGNCTDSSRGFYEKMSCECIDNRFIYYL